jgi:hypothetical protein
MLKALVSRGAIRLIVTPIIIIEFGNSPFQDIPEWCPVEFEPEGIAIAGIARSGMAMANSGARYRSCLMTFATLDLETRPPSSMRGSAEPDFCSAR